MNAMDFSFITLVADATGLTERACLDEPLPVKSRHIRQLRDMSV